MYIYIYVYIHIYIHIYTYSHTQAHAHTRTRTRALSSAHTRACGCQCNAVRPPSICRSASSVVCCSAAQSVATRHCLLQRSATRCNAAPPVASRRSHGQLPRRSPRRPLRLSPSAPLTAATGRNLPWSPSEHLRRRTECLVCRVLMPAALMSRGALLAFFRSVRRYMLCLVQLTPIRPHLRFGTALIAHHRTGLMPAHLCTGSKSTPHPHLQLD